MVTIWAVQAFQKANFSQWNFQNGLYHVRLGILFELSVTAEMRAVDAETIQTRLKRLSKIGRHPTHLVEKDNNFGVLIANEDERYAMLAIPYSE